MLNPDNAVVRRLGARILLIAVLVLGSLGIATVARDARATSAPTTRPNFVFVLTDDLSFNLLSRMQAVQSLQERGTSLSKYYVIDSLCCPSRSAIFTGEYPHNNGVFTNSGSDGGYLTYVDHGDDAKAFAVALQNAGYTTGFMGKYLNGYQPSKPIPPGWSEWDVTGEGYNEFNYTLNVNGKKIPYGDEPQDYLTDVVSDRGANFIEKSAASGNPFFLEVATFAPHVPYVPAPRYANSYPDLAYPRTPAYGTLPSDPPSWLAGRAPLTADEEAQFDAAYRQRVRADLAVDDLIANLEAALRRAGVADNTYLVFSSDNGYHMGEYRLFHGKQTAFDTDIHVPLVVTGPGVPAGRTDDRLAASIDLAPTFERLAGVPVDPDTVDGVSLAPLWHGQYTARWQQAVLIEHHGPPTSTKDPDYQVASEGTPPSYEAVRTADGVYVRYTATGEAEYYDTDTDPYELHNLGASGVPAPLRTALPALEKCTGQQQCQAAALLRQPRR